MGLLGKDMPPSREEREEDLLESLYRAWREERTLLAADFAMELKISRKELNPLLRKLAAYGYLEEPGKSGELELTDLGKAEGMECLMRHEKLTQFFQLIGGMEQEEAEEDACRVEHVISQKGLDGIDRFLRYGDVYDRTYTASDLSTFYDEGSYEMLMTVYEMERRGPRFLAAEQERFQETAVLEVKRGVSHFLLRLRPGQKVSAVWYRRREQWIRAERSGEEFRLPSDIFTYTVSAAVPITEAEAVIAITEYDTQPLNVDCRELNIHVW